MAKVYYWLRLKTDFFRDKPIKKLRKIAGGEVYTIIYLKLQLLSLKDEGKLYFDGIEDDFATELALEIDEDAENVKFTLMYLNKCGLIEEITGEELLLNAVPELIGKEGESASRVRDCRERKKQKTLQCNNEVTTCNTEIEIEKDIEIDIKEEKEKKHKHGAYAHVLLKDSELKKLNSEYGENETKDAITFLDEYMEMNGKKYKNCNLVLRKWVYDAVKEKKIKSITQQPSNKRFSNLDQRDYDYSDLEKQLLGTE